jgi:hypothetical protein
MKRLTATFPDHVQLNLSELMQKATDFKIETVREEAATLAPVRTRKMIPNSSVAQTIMQHFTPGGAFTSLQADLWAKQAGYSANSGGAACALLERMGCLVRAGTEGHRIVWKFSRPWEQRQEARAKPKLKAV